MSLPVRGGSFRSGRFFSMRRVHAVMVAAIGGVAVLSVMGGVAKAADTAWVGGTSGAWTTSGNWSAGVPTASDNAQLVGGGSATVISVTGTGLQANQLQVWSGAAYELSASGPATLTVADQVYVFSSPSASSLRISGPLLVTSPNGSLGTGPGDVGSSLTVGGGGAALQVAGTLNVGYDGANSRLEAQAGGAVQAGSLVVGALATGDNNDIDVTGGLVTATSSLVVGAFGGGNTVTVSSGTLAATGPLGAELGTAPGATSNQVAVSGGVFSSPSGLIVGREGSSNSFGVTDGGSATTGQARIGLLAAAGGNFGFVSGTGSQWTVNGTLRVGSAGSGNSLGISQGGVVTVAGANRNLWIGFEGSSDDNEVQVHGEGSVLDVSGVGSEIVVSASTTGTNRLVVLNSGSVNATSIQLGPNGTLLFGNGGVSPGTQAPGFLRSDATINGNDGGLASGGAVSFSHRLSDYVVPNVMSGPLDVFNFVDGKTTLTGSNTYTGATVLLSGTLALGPAGSIASSTGITLSVEQSTLDGSAVAGGFQLAAAQSLTGFGTVIGPFTAAAGSSIFPGSLESGGDPIGTITAVGGFTLLGELDVFTTGTVIGQIDGSAGTMTLGPSSILSVTAADPDPVPRVLATYASLVGTFGTVTGLPSGFFIDYNYLGGNQIALVPEPTVAVAGGVAVAALAALKARRRRRR